MKKMLVKLAAAMTVATAGLTALAADSITWIVPGSATGGFMMLSNFYAEQINNQGVKINVESRGNCVNGMGEFRRTDKPTAMIYTLDATDIALRKGCEFESPAVLQDSVTSHLMQGAAAVCTMDKNITSSDLRNGKEYVIAVDSARVERMTAVFNQLGIKFKPVQYENSGGTVKGMMGGDTQLSFTLAGKSEPVIKAGGQCLFVVGAGSIEGIPDVEKVFNTTVKYEDNTYVLLTKNLSKEQRAQLVDAVEKAKSSKEVADYAQKKWLVVPQNTSISELVDSAIKELF